MFYKKNRWYTTLSARCGALLPGAGAGKRMYPDKGNKKTPIFLYFF